MLWRIVFAAGLLALYSVAVADELPAQRQFWTYPGTALKNWCPQHTDDPKCQARLVPAPTVQVAPAPAQNWCAQAFAVLAAPGVDPFLKQAILEKARNRGCMQ
jgi:hypothetical protein